MFKKKNKTNNPVVENTLSTGEMLNVLGLKTETFLVGPSIQITKQVTAYYPKFDEQDKLIRDFIDNRAEVLSDGRKYIDSSSVFYDSFMSTNQVAQKGKIVTMWELQRTPSKLLDWLYNFESLKLVNRRHNYYQMFDDAALHNLIRDIYNKIEKLLNGDMVHAPKLFSMVAAAEYADADKLVELAINHSDDEIQHFVSGFTEVKKFKIPVVDYKELFNKI